MSKSSASSSRAARRRKLIVTGILLILCLPLSVAGGYLYSRSFARVYFADVSMAVKPEIQGADDGSSGNGFQPKRTGVIQSKEILFPAIDELNLGTKWAAGAGEISNEESYSRLLTMLFVKEPPTGDLVDIGIYSGDPQEAADIANAIAIRYRKRTGQDGVKAFDHHLKELDGQIDLQQRRVDNAQAELGSIRKQNSIVDPAPERLDPELNNFVQEYVSAKKTYLGEKKKLEETKAAYDKEMEPDSFPQPAMILENAVPPSVPVRPNVRLILVISAGVGLFFAIPGVVMFFLSWRVKM